MENALTKPRPATPAEPQPDPDVGTTHDNGAVFSNGVGYAIPEMPEPSNDG